jgi:hypothetical protein
MNRPSEAVDRAEAGTWDSSDVSELADEVRELRATIARVEALPEQWRESPHYDRETQDKCADQLAAALRGEP